MQTPFVESLDHLCGPQFNSDSAESARKKKYCERFLAQGLPTTKNEDWKYTNLQRLAQSKLIAAGLTAAGVKAALASDVQKQIEAAIAPYSGLSQGTRLVFVNGVLQDAWTRVKDVEVSEQLVSSTKIVSEDEVSALENLNSALVSRSLVITVGKGKEVSDLVQIFHFAVPQIANGLKSNGTESDTWVVPTRVSVHAEARCRAQMLEVFLTLANAEAKCFTSVVTDVVCEEESDFEVTKLQLESVNTTHISHLRVLQKDKSKFTSNVFHFGGGLVRNEIHPVLDGERIESYLNGLTVVRGSQHVDNFTIIDHAKPNCFSRELYKGVYADSAKGVFSGTIIVRPDAQKTNAIQSNKSILLSDSASIETRPQLKIWADDVKCTHGATIGQLDEDARFYLRSRGIPSDVAQAMLLQAFAGDIVTHIASQTVREVVYAQLTQTLGQLGE